jgi:hypothetical protein
MGKVIVDIVHPDLPRISKVNRLFLDHCLVSQKPFPVSGHGTVMTLRYPTTLALLALKLNSATHCTMWLTGHHDLRDALTLIAHTR